MKFQARTLFRGWCRLTWLVLWLVYGAGAMAQEPGPGVHFVEPVLHFGESVHEAVRTEGLRANDDPAGRPLPLAAHWHRETLPLTNQVELINQGYPILPWMNYARREFAADWALIHSNSLSVVRSWNLPIVLLCGGQWDGDFYKLSEYEALPLEETGLGMNLDGSRMSVNSPFSPVQPWYDLGVKWSSNTCVETFEALYPDPPRVIFMSNNEVADLGWREAETSKRFVDMYGTNRTDEFKKEVFGYGWADRYSALFQGMRDGLSLDTWRTNSLYVGYNAYGSDQFGRGVNHWFTTNRLAWQPLAWDGAVPEVYDNDWEPDKTAFLYWSMQIEAMNLAFHAAEVFETNPDFWLELISWDGDTWRSFGTKTRRYDYAGVDYTPELYKGWTQYTMWLCTPRVMREWRSSTDSKTNWWPYFQGILDMVKSVHDTPILARFWREGRIVLNTEGRHPWQTSVPDKWKDTPRWYHLFTDRDPALNWKNDSRVQLYKEHNNREFPVWTLARVIGEAPHREWLLYAFAPMGDQQDVAVKIPDYGVVIVDVDVGGIFYHIVEDPNHEGPLVGHSGLRLHYTFDHADETTGIRSESFTVTRMATIDEAHPDTAYPDTLEVDESVGARQYAFFELVLTNITRELSRVDILLSGTSVTTNDTVKPYVGARVYTNVVFDPAAATWNSPPVDLTGTPDYEDIEGFADDKTDWQLFLTRPVRAAWAAGATRVLVALYNVNDPARGTFTDRTVMMSNAPQVVLYQGRGRDILHDVSGNGFDAHMATDDAGTNGVRNEAIDFVYDNTSELILLPVNVRNSFDMERLLDTPAAIAYWAHGTVPSFSGGTVVGTEMGPEGWKIINANLEMRFCTEHEGVSTEWTHVTVPTDDQWHHVAFVVESDHIVNAYLDGEPYGSGGPIALVPGRDGLGMGLRGRDLMMDDLRIYDCALSAAQVAELYAVRAEPDTDYDADGLSDLLDPDDDNDGMRDADEAVAGTDSLDAESVFQVSACTWQGGRFRLSVETVTGRMYGVEYKTDLMDTNDWVELTNDWPGTGGIMELGDGAGAPQRFYRVRVRMEE